MAALAQAVAFEASDNFVVIVYIAMGDGNGGNNAIRFILMNISAALGLPVVLKCDIIHFDE